MFMWQEIFTQKQDLFIFDYLVLLIQSNNQHPAETSGCQGPTPMTPMRLLDWMLHHHTHSCLSIKKSVDPNIGSVMLGAVSSTNV